jgi:hypothetical protein
MTTKDEQMDLDDVLEAQAAQQDAEEAELAQQAATVDEHTEMKKNLGMAFTEPKEGGAPKDNIGKGPFQPKAVKRFRVDIILRNEQTREFREASGFLELDAKTCQLDEPEILAIGNVIQACIASFRSHVEERFNILSGA